MQYLDFQKTSIQKQNLKHYLSLVFIILQMTTLNGEDILRTQQQVLGYRFVRVIGRDIDGRLVFQGINYKHERKAIKVIELGINNVGQGILECIFCTNLNYPNITEFYEFIFRNMNKQLCLLMEYCDGNIGIDYRQIPEPQMLQFMDKIIDAVKYLHENKRTAHGDIRMESVHTMGKGKNRDIKFGFFSLDLNNEIPRKVYLPPQVNDSDCQESTRPMDIWMLGLLLLEMASKMRIFEILFRSKIFDRKNPLQAFRTPNFHNDNLFNSLKLAKFDGLIRPMISMQPSQRPTIGAVKMAFKKIISDKDFVILKQPSRNKFYFDPETFQYEPRNQGRPKNEVPKEKYEQIHQKASENPPKQAYLVIPDQEADKAKIKVLSLNNMSIPRILPIKDVINLQWLYLQSNEIKEIEHLDHPHLKGLNLAHNKITKIKGLDRLLYLEEMYLDENFISKIQNVSELRNLKCLSLKSNKIRIIENLECNVALKTLNLIANPVDISLDLNVEAINNLKRIGANVVLKEKQKETNK